MRPTVTFLVLAATILLPLATIAAPIVPGAQPETLVEGHTVFLTLDTLARLDPADPWGDLQRERVNQSPSVDRFHVHRAPGVLWPNDQYLTAPSQSIVFEESLGGGTTKTAEYAAAVAILVRGDDGDSVREPCGGAVLAANAGGADPRASLAPELLLSWTYVESYRVVDPNDHAWIVDKYLLADPDPRSVWVANVLGAPAFAPDLDRAPANDCLADKEALESLADGPQAPLVPSPLARSAGCGLHVSNGDVLSTTGNDDITLNPYGSVPAWSDSPCTGFMEPSRNGYCYAGVRATDRDENGMVDKNDCVGEAGVRDRRYNALLYLDWADLTVAGPVRDHSDPLGSLATNGCQSGTEWPCLDEATWEIVPGSEDEEGDSHAFHPWAPVHEEQQDCLVEFGGPNPTNHGGSALDGPGACDYAHESARIEVFFSADARPLEPALRTFRVVDSAGSSDPFADHHMAYPGWP